MQFDTALQCLSYLTDSCGMQVEYLILDNDCKWKAGSVKDYLIDLEEFDFFIEEHPESGVGTKVTLGPEFELPEDRDCWVDFEHKPFVKVSDFEKITKNYRGSSVIKRLIAVVPESCGNSYVVLDIGTNRISRWKYAGYATYKEREQAGLVK